MSGGETVDLGRQLMLAFQRGDEAAFDRLASLYEPRIHALARRYGLDGPSADDLVQDTLLRVYRARSRYTPQARFDAWILRIVRNLLIGAARKRKRRRTRTFSAQANDDGSDPVFVDPRAPAPGARLDADERAQRVREALDSLPDKQRLALLLHRFEGLSYEEIGQTLGLRLPAVKSLLFRARQNLKTRLAPYMGGGP